MAAKGNQANPKGGIGMDYNPTITYIATMLARMRPETVRAVYMVVQELDRMAVSANRIS